MVYWVAIGVFLVNVGNANVPQKYVELNKHPYATEADCKDTLKLFREKFDNDMKTGALAAYQIVCRPIQNVPDVKVPADSPPPVPKEGS